MRRPSILIAMSLLGGAALSSAQLFDSAHEGGTGLQIIQLVDSGRYAEVWKNGSSALKTTITEPRFVESLTKARQSAGTVTKRVQVAVTEREAEGNSDLPDGSYVTVRYATAFANDHAAHERVSLRLEHDGIWRIVDYVIEPSEPSFARNLDQPGDATLVNRR